MTDKDFVAWHSTAHPFLRVVGTRYLTRPIETEALMPFFHGRCLSFGSLTENDYPKSAADLSGWVEAALEFGCQVKAKSPPLVREIFAEAGEERVQFARGLVRLIIERAGSVEPEVLAATMWAWHAETREWPEPLSYPLTLQRMSFCVRLAICTPWLFSACTGDEFSFTQEST